ncbi:MAG: nucleoside/nucleotide kinase family protein [Gluconacetobacter diazotrophicus]|nr:nucleoside/nucleotide kinase family protein [Gluconacetobacter diazotrophicus]
METATLPPELLARAERLLAAGGRRVLGIAGAPGGGKSTLAAALGAALGSRAAVVPMDGFHLAQCELERLGRASRKGAPDTFDAAGFVSLLRRLRGQGSDEVVYAPSFRREIEEPVAGAIAVEPSVPLVITEGNYLLLDTHGFAPVRALLDESWFVAPAEADRLRWLLARHMAFGRTEEAARRWIEATDAPNARLILESAPRADLVVGSSSGASRPEPATIA